MALVHWRYASVCGTCRDGRQINAVCSLGRHECTCFDVLETFNYDIHLRPFTYELGYLVQEWST